MFTVEKEKEGKRDIKGWRYRYREIEERRRGK